MNPIAAASNAASSTNGSSLEKAKNAAFAAGGAAAGAAGAAAVATRDTASRAGQNVSALASGGSEKDLQGEITKLKGQLADATKRAGQQTAQVSQSGVPVNVVACLVFSAFIIGYLFF